MTVSETNTANGRTTIRAARMALLAGMALLLLLGFQVASAQAETVVDTVWAEEGQPLTANGDQGLVGQISTPTPIGKISCSVDSDVTLSPNGAGKIDGFFTDCSGTSYNCKINTSYSAGSQPWRLQLESDNRVRVDDAKWNWTFTDCNYNATWEVSTGIDFYSDNSEAISAFTMQSGILLIAFGGPPSTALGELHGEAEVSEPGRFGMTEIEYDSTDPGIWLQDGDPIEEAQEVEFDGRASIFKNSSGSEFECAVHGAAVFGPEAGSLTEFEFDPEDCTGAGVLSECEISSAELVGSPALIAHAAEMAASEFKVTTVWQGEGCPLGGLTTTTAVELVLAPENQTWMSSLALSGKGGSLLVGKTPIASKVEMAGEVDVMPAFTFGLEPAEY